MKKILLALTLSIAAQLVSAQPAKTFSGVPITLITDSQSYGKCMARFSNLDLGSYFTQCAVKPDYISFDCAGGYIDKSAAASNWSQIQLAFVLGTAVAVTVNGLQKYNANYCVGQSVQVTAQ